MSSEFIWCDLSALRLEKAAAFYMRVLGWDFDDPSESYRYAYCEREPVAALFDMPALFREINMPSFWMSYIHVDSVSDSVQTASEIGGKVELEDKFGDGKIALIRDPLGAGFTIYEGDMQSGAEGARNGLRVGHTLHVSSQQAVTSFYKSLFSWEISGVGENQWHVLSKDGHQVAEIRESPDAERGGFEYWGVTFAVDDLEKCMRAITDSGGTVFSETLVGARKAFSVADMDGAAFSVASVDKDMETT